MRTVISNRSIRLRIDDAALAALDYPGGDNWEFIKKIGRDARNISKAAAPVRGGKLKASIKLAMSKHSYIGPQATVRSERYYAVFVHEGTAGKGAGYIYPKRFAPVLGVDGRYRQPMLGPMRPWRHHTTVYAPRVRGQKPNKFLAYGMRAALRANRVL